VAQLMCHDARHFIVSAGRLEHAAVEEHRAAGQRERVDLPQVHDIERVSKRRLLQPRGNGGHEPAADLFDECVGGPIVQQRQLLTDFGGGPASKLDIL
jgi:hypothetical protein